VSIKRCLSSRLEVADTRAVEVGIKNLGFGVVKKPLKPQKHNVGF